MTKAKTLKKTAKPIRKALQKAQSADDNLRDLEDVRPILKFLDDFQRLTDPRAQLPSKLISIKIPEPLLAAFRFKAQQAGLPYQTMIKKLMEAWLNE